MDYRQTSLGPLAGALPPHPHPDSLEPPEIYRASAAAQGCLVNLLQSICTLKRWALEFCVIFFAVWNAPGAIQYIGILFEAYGTN